MTFIIAYVNIDTNATLNNKAQTGNAIINANADNNKYDFDQIMRYYRNWPGYVAVWSGKIASGCYEAAS